jgi:hypothetical protein
MGDGALSRARPTSCPEVGKAGHRHGVTLGTSYVRLPPDEPGRVAQVDRPH